MTKPLDQTPSLDTEADTKADTDYVVFDDPPLLLKPQEYNPDAIILLASLGVVSAAFITAWNPKGSLLSDDENDDRQERLLAEIEQARCNYLVAARESEHLREYSYLILGIDKSAADDLAVQFEQDNYLWLDDTGVPELVVT